jgi:hypothetical protein
MKGGTTMKLFFSFLDSLHSESRRAFYDQYTAIAHVMHLVLLLPLAGL